MSQDNPKVSVIIPVYNVENYLRECLDSVVNQTLKDIEIICVDDGSTDGSLTILREYEAKDARFHVLTQNNRYAGVARNRGMEQAKGQYYMFLDADDFFEADMLDKMYVQASTYDADICLCGADSYDINQKKYSPMSWCLNIKEIKTQPFCSTDTANIFTVANPAPWTKLISAEFIRQHKLQFQDTPRINDMYFTYCAMALAKKIVYVDSAFVHYRIGQNANLQSGIYKTPTLCCDVWLSIKRRLEKEPCWKTIEDMFLHAAGRNLTFNIGMLKDYPEAKRVLIEEINNSTFQALGLHGCPLEIMIDQESYQAECADAKSARVCEKCVEIWMKWIPESEKEDSFKCFWQYRRAFPGCKKLAAQLTHEQAAALYETYVKIPKYVSLAGRYAENAEWKPVVSVIIPIYDVEEYLRECLDSIVNQTLENIEIICVNDGSPDDSLSIAEEYQKKDPRITVISQANGGLSVARNIGMQFAHGKYIYFIDSDDYLDITALEKLTELAERERLDVLRFGIKAFYSSEQLKNTHSINHRASGNNVTTEILTGVEYLKDCRDKSIYVTSACLFLLRHDLLTENNIIFKEGIIHEDNLFSFQIFMTAKRVMEVPNTFYHRRVREGSIMTRAKSANNVIGYFSCAMGVLEYALNNDDPLKEQEIKREYNRMLYAARRDYEALSPQERKKVVFASEMENELFKQLVVNGGTLIKTRNELNETRGALDSINKSVSFRVGRAITWVPRKVRGGVRCYQEHGPAYTFDRTLYHMHLQWLPQKVSGGVRCYQEHGAAYTFDRLLVHARLKEDPEHPKKRDYAYYSTLPPKKYPKELKLWYKRVMKEDLDLDNPKTFNEKIQWMKLYDSTPLKTRLADKYLVRDWIKEKIGDEYLVPLLGVWDRFDEIDFDKLPDQFVLKANHGSGWNIIVKDKALFDREDVKRKFDRWMNLNYAFFGLELHYMNIPPKIIAEKYLENAEGLKDFRFYCFNGKPSQVWVDIFSGTPQHLRSIFDMDWNPVNMKCTWPDGGDLLQEKPKNFELMKEYAELLSKDFAFVRVDFFEIEGKLYMGEMTFTPMDGTGRFEPKSWDTTLGDMLTLPPKSPIPMRLIYQDKCPEV